MDHLSNEQMLAFITGGEKDSLSLEEMRGINAHLKVCAECRRRMARMQDVYDEMLRFPAADEKQDL